MMLPRMHMAALLLFALLNLLDVASTHAALRIGLPEGNPIPALLLALGGTWSMYAFKAITALGVAVAVVRLSPRYRRIWYSLHAGNLVLATVVLMNLVQVLPL